MWKLALAAIAIMATFSAAAFSVCAVGDSITQGGGTKFVPHRVALEAEFAARGWNVEWKGTRTDPVSPNYCEGYSGKDANYIAGQYEAHAADVAADVLLIHAGHNYNCGDAKLTPAVRTTEDIVAEATNSHARIIAAARAEKPDVIVLYAQVISSGGDREVKYSYITNGLNQAIATLGAELDTDASPVIVVDMAEGWNYAEDCVSDCVHPTAAGAAKMAAKWMAALKPLAAAGRLPGVDAHRKVQLWKDGPSWADTNIGAYEPWESGDFFWWGDTIGYSYDGEGWVASDGSSSGFQFVYGDASNETYGKRVDTLSGEEWITASGVLAPERDAAQVRWGGDWRLPTEKEIADLVDNCDWTLTTTNGVSGFVVCGRGAYSANSIFLPAAGWGNDSIHNVNEASYFWSSVPYASYYAHMLRISIQGGEVTSYTAEHTDRYFGFSVRPVQTYAPPAPVVGGEWLDERAGTTLTTGAWSSPVAYGSDGRAAIKDNTFTPTVASTASVVKVEAKARFFVDDREYTPAATDQAAIRLTSSGFQVWTGGAWLAVAAPGVTPEDGEEYTLRFTFDYTKGMYSVETGGLRFRATGGTENFPLAASTTAVSSIAFMGDTDFTSLVGEYVTVTGFAENEEIALAGATNVLTAARALWLSGLGATKAEVAAAAASLSADDFDAAYLLNIDFTEGEFSYSFEITDIAVHSDHVAVEVTLVRDGAVNGEVNGTLNFYGAATLEAFKSGGTLVGTATLTENEFGEGERATATINLGGETPPAFFKAKIEE